MQADQARREADALSMLNRALLRTGHGVEELLGAGLRDLRHDLGDAAARDAVGGWAVVAARGADAPLAPEDADAGVGR